MIKANRFLTGFIPHFKVITDNITEILGPKT
jgi:hypothetical protein